MLLNNREGRCPLTGCFKQREQGALPRSPTACVRHPALLWVLVDVFVSSRRSHGGCSDLASGLKFLVTANSYVAPEQNPSGYRSCRSLSSPPNPSHPSHHGSEPSADIWPGRSASPCCAHHKQPGQLSTCVSA